MTVCIAALFRWNYAPIGMPPNHGSAAITLSDRMITTADVKYEPRQFKVAFLNERAVILIAGDISLHSQAIKDIQKRLRGTLNSSPHNIALMYGGAVQTIKLKQAEDLYLAPLGMNADTFLAQQRDMSNSFISMLTKQMQNYRGDDVEALVVGVDNDIAQIYAVDTKGMISCCDDVGFAAIGIGAWHAKSRLMQTGYTNSLYFAPALAAVYAAKKAAEIAPGVGTNTDIHLILKDQIFLLWPHVADKLDELYNNYEEKRAKLGTDTIAQLQTFINTPAKQELLENEKSKEIIPGGSAQTNERASPPATETARKDETGKR